MCPAKTLESHIAPLRALCSVCGSIVVLLLVLFVMLCCRDVDEMAALERAMQQKIDFLNQLLEVRPAAG